LPPQLRLHRPDRGRPSTSLAEQGRERIISGGLSARLTASLRNTIRFSDLSRDTVYAHQRAGAPGLACRITIVGLASSPAPAALSHLAARRRR